MHSQNLFVLRLKDAERIVKRRILMYFGLLDEHQQYLYRCSNEVNREKENDREIEKEIEDQYVFGPLIPSIRHLFLASQYYLIVV